MSRSFFKISFDKFKLDISCDKCLYDGFVLPKRKTKYAAGYDFFALQDYIIKPKEILKIPTGVKACMNEDEVLLLVDRSSIGFKYNVRLTNQVGVIDCDYFDNNTNEGHIWVSLQNEGDKDFIIKKGDAFCQGIFTKYLLCDDESVDFSDRIGRY